MSINPYTFLIPNDIGWYRDEAHYREQNPVVPFQDPTKNRRLWVDKSLSYGTPSLYWWLPPSSPSGPKEYELLARDESGNLLLVDPYNPVLQTVYSQSALAAIKENAFFFSGTGVPYTQKVALKTEDLTGFNFSSKLPTVDYPITVRTDVVLIPAQQARALGAPVGWDCYTMPYQEFIQLMQPKKKTPEAVIEDVKAVCASPESARNKILMVRKLVTDYTTPLNLA